MHRAGLARLWLSLWLALALAWLGGIPLPAAAHDPFDGNVQLFVYANKIEARVTLGFDASREFLRASGLPSATLAQLRQPPPDTLPQLPAAQAHRLLQLRDAGQPLAATALFAALGATESNFVAIYPRPANERLEVQAAYLSGIAHMRPGMLVVADQQHRVLFSKLLSPGSAAATVPLTPDAARGNDAGPGVWFKLGVQHILEGYDHLLFLCALLLGMRRLRSMLVVITCFTVAHSATLALTALGLLPLRPNIVEPLIAASITVACLANLWRKDDARSSYAMASVFGLIHGCGFAGALREAGLGQDGSPILLPLLSFNAGVEAGQILVAAVVVPLLFLLRRKPAAARYGIPALSLLMTLASLYWLDQLLW